MAHGGHHSHSHHHYHHRSYSSRSSGSEDGIIIAAVIFGVIISIFAMAAGSSISGKKPLEGHYETYESYLIDREEYFYSSQDLISGLEYLHEKTNVQIVVMTSNESWSDRKAVTQYNNMFNDEGHILIVIPTSWFSSTEYYAIGDLADSVIGDYEIDYLLDKINHSKDGAKWNTCLKDFADKLLSD